METLTTQFISSNFDFISDTYDSELPLELNIKYQLYDLLLRQGFVLRHFGTTSADKISDISGVFTWYLLNDGVAPGERIPISGEDRVRQLLEDPSTERAKHKFDAYGNFNIAMDVS